MDDQDTRGSLDGTTSGTVGGGSGADPGGPGARSGVKPAQTGDPASAASGRVAPDAVPVPTEPDPPGQGATNVSAVRDSVSSARH